MSNEKNAYLDSGGAGALSGSVLAAAREKGQRLRFLRLFLEAVGIAGGEHDVHVCFQKGVVEKILPQFVN